MFCSVFCAQKSLFLTSRNTIIGQTVFLMNSPYATISRSALKNNAKILRELCAPARFYAVIKANAYGHGLIETAQIIENFVDGFCVGTVSEGATLRLAGIKKPVLCLIPPALCEFYRAEAYNLQICAQSLSALKMICEYSKIKTPPKFHLAVNTGMNRLGINVDEVSAAAKVIKQKSLPLCGAFSHLYRADDYCSSKRQLELFKAANLLKTEFRGVELHISSSGGLFLGNDFKLDAVRVGLALYGYGGAKNGVNIGLKPALKIYAPILQSRKVSAGEHLLYGDFCLKTAENVHILSYGYYHGAASAPFDLLNFPCMNVSSVKSRAENPCDERENAICVWNGENPACDFSGSQIYRALTSASELRKFYVE